MVVWLAAVPCPDIVAFAYDRGVAYHREGSLAVGNSFVEIGTEQCSGVHKAIACKGKLPVHVVVGEC